MKAPKVSQSKAERLAALVARPPRRLGRRKRGPVRDFDVRDFGAKGNGRTLDTAAFQAAIDAAAAFSGHARVLVRGGKKYLLSALELKGAIDFHLADDAELRLSTNWRDYRGIKVFLRAEGADGLRISGTGRINGRGREFMRRFDKKDEWWRPKHWRPRLFEIAVSRGVEITDITFGAAPAWGLHLLGCEHVLVDGVKIRNDLDLPNCDGIGPDHCRDVEIRNCDIVCGDDGVVIKTTRQPVDLGPCAHIVVKDCVITTQDSAVKIGTETTQDIHDIRIERIKVPSSCRAFNIQLRDEGNVYDVKVNDVTFSTRFHSPPWWGRGEPISLTAVPRLPETKLGKIHDVCLKNFRGQAENSARVQGSKRSRPRNIRLENIALKLDRWTQYPGGMFDNRPTKVVTDLEPHGTPGFSIREADHVTLDRCSIDWGKNIPDYFTYAVEVENANKVFLRKFRGQAAHPERDDAIVTR